MTALLRELIALSVLSGAALFLCPEGGVKRVLSVLTAAILCISVLGRWRDFDYGALALDQARIRQAEDAIGRQAEEQSRALNRLYVQEQLAAYVQSLGERLGIENLEAEIQVEWSLDGLWVPCAIRIRGVEEEKRTELSRLLRSELGIPEERQEWEA